MFLLFCHIHSLNSVGDPRVRGPHLRVGGGGDTSSLLGNVQVLTFGIFVLCLYFSLFGFLYLAELCIFDNFPNLLILSVFLFT